MPDRLRLGVIFGGRSVEHEVSVVSAQHVMASADRDLYEVVPIGVTREGVWLTVEETRANLDRDEPPFRKSLVAPDRRAAGSFLRYLREDALRGSGFSLRPQRPGPAPRRDYLQGALDALRSIDVAFPLVHGTQGEDGCLQGLLEIAGIPYVGCGVAASALGMDKGLMKAVFRDAGLRVARHVVLTSIAGDEQAVAAARRVESDLGLPVFVKPANGGSSVGVVKAGSREELVNGLLQARAYDRRVVVEQAVAGREVECAVLGNEDAEASPVGEVRHQREFYDYEAKYLDPRTQVIAPADLPAEVAARVQEAALRAFRAIDGAGLSRVDFFLTPGGDLVVDEINTLPGFTPASMFPRLWAVAGVSYSELITRLVQLAWARHKEQPVA